MKTPYDNALRALQRDVDELRTAIGDAAQRLTDVETHRETVTQAIVRESRLAATDWTFSPAPYLARARATRDRLDEAQAIADAELDALRGQAMERYGSLRAIEGAATQFREDAGRSAAAAEQAGADDVAGARFGRRLRLARQQARGAR